MIDADQIAEWEWFYELEPWGALQEDRRAARIAAVIVNRIPLQGKGSKPVREQDLFASLKPDTDAPEQADKPDAIKSKLMRMANATGGKVRKAAEFRREWEEKQRQKMKRAERPPDLPAGRRIKRRGEKRD